jgi:hypothetical protein
MWKIFKKMIISSEKENSIFPSKYYDQKFLSEIYSPTNKKNWFRFDKNWFR